MSAATSLDIINQALAQAAARSKPLTSINDQSNEGRYARLFYDDTRQGLLRAAHWQFAEKTAALTLQKAAPGTPENTASAETWTNAYPAPPWLYQYAYPSDCLQMRLIVPMLPIGSQTVPGATPAVYPYGMAYPNNSMVAFQKAHGTTDDLVTEVVCILTNQPNAIAKYTKDVTDVSKWDASFEDAMVASLASRFAIPISGSKTLFKLKAQEAYAAVMEARERDGNEGTTQSDHIPDWLAVRGIGPNGNPGYQGFTYFTPGWLLVTGT